MEEQEAKLTERQTTRKRKQNAVSGQTEEANMHSKVDESTEDIIEYEVRGKLAGKELAAIARYGKIRLLISMPEIPRPDLAAFGKT